MSILEELYDGNIRPFERYIKSDSEYQKLSNQLSEHLNTFMTLLNDKEKQLYEKIEAGFSDLNYISEKECFIEGFRIGVQIMWEVIHFKSKNYSQ